MNRVEVLSESFISFKIQVNEVQMETISLGWKHYAYNYLSCARTHHGCYSLVTREWVVQTSDARQKILPCERNKRSEPCVLPAMSASVTLYVNGVIS